MLILKVKRLSKVHSNFHFYRVAMLINDTRSCRACETSLQAPVSIDQLFNTKMVSAGKTSDLSSDFPCACYRFNGGRFVEGVGVGYGSQYDLAPKPKALIAGSTHVLLRTCHKACSWHRRRRECWCQVSELASSLRMERKGAGSPAAPPSSKWSQGGGARKGRGRTGWEEGKVGPRKGVGSNSYW